MGRGDVTAGQPLAAMLATACAPDVPIWWGTLPTGWRWGCDDAAAWVAPADILTAAQEALCGSGGDGLWVGDCFVPAGRPVVYAGQSLPTRRALPFALDPLPQALAEDAGLVERHTRWLWIPDEQAWVGIHVRYWPLLAGTPLRWGALAESPRPRKAVVAVGTPWQGIAVVLPVVAKASALPAACQPRRVVELP